MTRCFDLRQLNKQNIDDVEEDEEIFSDDDDLEPDTKRRRTLEEIPEDEVMTPPCPPSFADGADDRGGLDSVPGLMDMPPSEALDLLPAQPQSPPLVEQPPLQDGATSQISDEPSQEPEQDPPALDEVTAECYVPGPLKGKPSRNDGNDWIGKTPYPLVLCDPLDNMGHHPTTRTTSCVTTPTLPSTWMTWSKMACQAIGLSMPTVDILSSSTALESVTSGKSKQVA